MGLMNVFGFRRMKILNEYLQKHWNFLDFELTRHDAAYRFWILMIRSRNQNLPTVAPAGMPQP
jgi:hypothetical protein